VIWPRWCEVVAPGVMNVKSFSELLLRHGQAVIQLKDQDDQEAIPFQAWLPSIADVPLTLAFAAHTWFDLI
jgi:hypothetical protein